MNWIPDLVAGLRDIAIIVFLGYGLKLMKQQNELLEREKALKQSEIDVHRANIERLKVLQAPAIARDLEQMTRTAEHYAQKKNELEERVKTLAIESQAMQGMVDMSNIVGIAAGSLEAWALVSRTRRWASGLAALSGKAPDEDTITIMLDENLAAISEVIDKALEGQKPELKHWKGWIAEKRATDSVGGHLVGPA